jgi:hypothetical protein
MHHLPTGFFHPDHPFIGQTKCKPLPFLLPQEKAFSNHFGNNDVRWIIQEELTSLPPNVDLIKAFNCFKIIPSQGAKYVIKICVDVPDNNSPLDLPPYTGSESGHTFIVLTKSNGPRSVTQVFGFYATKHPGYINPWKGMTSVIKNNQLREINASDEMSLTADQFNCLREKALELAKHKYEAASYNCTNFALDLFNAVRAKPIIIETFKVQLPVMQGYFWSQTDEIIIEKTPQKLYKKLSEMKKNHDPEASNIQLDLKGKTTAPLSHGECN